MNSLQTKIDEAVSLSFSHNRGDVDVFVWNSEGEKILAIKKCSADLFLEYFDYGTTIYDPSGYDSTDSEEVMKSFLLAAI